MSDILKLAERCEAALESSARLDLEIADAIGAVDFALPYTESFDAAIALVPEGANWTVSSADPWLRHDAEGRVSTKMESGLFISRAATPAIALCAAALRARDAQAKQLLQLGPPQPR